MPGPIQSSISGAISATAAGVAVAKAIHNQEEEKKENLLEQQKKEADAKAKKEAADLKAAENELKKKEMQPMVELQQNKKLIKDAEGYIKAHGSLPWGTRGKFQMLKKATDSLETEIMKKRFAMSGISKKRGGNENG